MPVLDAQLTRRGDEGSRGQVLSYLAADGTEFRVRTYGNRIAARDAARQHSINVIQQANPGIEYKGGLWLDSKGGSFADWGAAAGSQQGISLAKGELETALTEARGEIKAVGEADIARTERLGGRRFGAELGILQRALSAQGIESGRAGQLISRVGAGQQRFLGDIVEKQQLGTQRELAQFGKFGVTAGLTLEDIQGKMTQFLMSQGLRREEIELQLEMQPGLLEQFLGSVGRGVGTGIGLYGASQFPFG